MPPTKRRASVSAAMAEAAAMDEYDEYDDLRPSKHAGVKRLSDEITCEICQGVLRDPATLPCCHTFCLACVEDKLQGHGVYESKCPQCGMPLHFKDLRVNQSYNGVIEQIESARARFSAEPSTRCEEAGVPIPGPGPVSARTPESGTTSRPLPSAARCREIASDVRDIDAALAFLATRLETANHANRRTARDEKEDDRGASETLPSPTPIYVSYTRDTRTTDPNATACESERARGSLPTPRGTVRPTASAAQSPTPTRATSDSNAARDVVAPPRQSQVRSLTAPQARRLYAAAHGKQPPKRVTHALKKLHAELEKLDAGLVEQLIGIVLQDERDAAEANARERPGEEAADGGPLETLSEPHASEPAVEPERTEPESRVETRVFAYARAAPSVSSRSESPGGARGKRKAAALAEALTRANDAIAAASASDRIEPAIAVDSAGGFPERATHLLMDASDGADATRATTTTTTTTTGAAPSAACRRRRRPPSAWSPPGTPRRAP